MNPAANIILRRKQSFVNELDRCHKCPESYNSKTLNTNNDVIQTLTQTQRRVNVIRYSHGGFITYGNENVNNNIVGSNIFKINNNIPSVPLKNKF